LNRIFKFKLILAIIASFFIFQLFLFLKSFPAEYNLYFRFLERLETADPFWTSFWFNSEIIGEIGLTLRFAGSCFALYFIWLIVKKGKTVISHLRKAVLCEGSYYLFNLPFIISLFARPDTTIVNIEAGLSYLLQIVFVSPAFLILYTKMKKPNLDLGQVYKWGAIGIVGFTFALWIKHALMNLYALPISLSDPLLLAGLLNSTFTMLIAGLILLITLAPKIRQKQLNYNSKPLGFSFLFIGLYFVIYTIISFYNASYSSFLVLTEFWAIAFIIPGIGYILQRS
jgi:hypothetical protein